MIKFLIDPFNILLFIIIICVAARGFNLKLPFKWLLIITLSWFYVISTPFIPNTLLNSLESRYVPIVIEQFSEQELEAEYHILVLGGGHGFDDRLPPNSLLSLQALARLNEGVRLHRELPNSTLILSGYSSSGRATQAEMLYKTALQLGVDGDSMLMQKEPSNTSEEAEVYYKRFGSDNPLILVTSASHMPRAAGAFGRRGLNPLPSPAHYRLRGGLSMKNWWWPSLGNISNLNTAMNEYAAIHRDWWIDG